MARCNRCNSEMVELKEDYENMSEGQQINHDMGFNRPFYCEKCKIQTIRDVEVYDNLPDDAYDMIDDEINYEYFEDLIDRAIDKRCFIEVTSLIHNAIEFELCLLLEDNIKKINNIDSADFFDKSKKKIYLKKIKTSAIKKKIEIVQGHKKLKYLGDYYELCFILNLISPEQYNEISTFNKHRNTTIHKLIKKKGDKCKIRT